MTIFNWRPIDGMNSHLQVFRFNKSFLAKILKRYFLMGLSNIIFLRLAPTGVTATAAAVVAAGVAVVSERLESSVKSLEPSSDCSELHGSDLARAAGCHSVTLLLSWNESCGCFLFLSKMPSGLILRQRNFGSRDVIFMPFVNFLMYLTNPATALIQKKAFVENFNSSLEIQIVLSPLYGQAVTSSRCMPVKLPETYDQQT